MSLPVHGTDGFYPPLALFINGRWEGADGRSTRAVVNPATEAEIGRLPEATDADIDAAIDAARLALPAWRQFTPQQRGEFLFKAAALMRERRETIAQTITLELGKPITQSRVEIERMTALFEWHASEGCRVYGRIVPAREGLEAKVVREPVGVVAAFTPWNGPGASPSRKISAALAAGCCVVIKPAEETPGSAIHIARCLADAGLPPGVMNMVFGQPARISERLIASPVVRSFSFTGSVPVGRALAELGARHLKPGEQRPEVHVVEGGLFQPASDYTGMASRTHLRFDLSGGGRKRSSVTSTVGIPAYRRSSAFAMMFRDLISG